MKWFVLLFALMAQYGLPDSDVTIDANFIQCAGGAGSFTFLDEGFGAGRGSGSGPDDDTTINKHVSEGSTAFSEFGLSDVTDPVSSANHIIRARVRRNTTTQCTASSTGQQQDHTIVLMQGTTTIATNNQANVTTYVTQAYTLSGAEADSITDYSNLRLRAYRLNVGGGSARQVTISALEFECPDAAVATKNIVPLLLYRRRAS